MGTKQHPIDCVVRILGSIISAIAPEEDSVGPTKSGRGTIDMSRMAMLKRVSRLYRIGRGCYLVSYFRPARPSGRRSVGSLLLPDLVLLSY